MSIVKMLKTQLEADKEVLKAKKRDVALLEVKVREYELAIKKLNERVFIQ